MGNKITLDIKWEYLSQRNKIINIKIFLSNVTQEIITTFYQ